MTTREINLAVYLLRAVNLGISLRELALVEVGTIFDMMTELGNDNEEYPYKATQEDFDRF